MGISRGSRSAPIGTLYFSQNKSTIQMLGSIPTGGSTPVLIHTPALRMVIRPAWMKRLIPTVQSREAFGTDRAGVASRGGRGLAADVGREGHGHSFQP